MERNDCGSGYGMGMQVNFAGIQAEKRITVTKEAGDSTAAAADVSRRRKPVVKKYKGIHKKKRMSGSTDAFVPPPLPRNVCSHPLLLLLLLLLLLSNVVAGNLITNYNGMSSNDFDFFRLIKVSILFEFRSHSFQVGEAIGQQAKHQLL
ncbi:hypothetical protein L1887_10093 [Cichorium endivia]|nr:hypothetical protein L1887_10093 [Cichorium endivia]